MSRPLPYVCTLSPHTPQPAQPGGLSVPSRGTGACTITSPVATSPSNDEMYRRLVSFFSIPRVALPLSSPALQRLIALVLAGWDVRAYPRLGASAHDLDDPTGWNVWLHDRRMLLSDWLTCFAETPVPSDATPVAPVAPAAPARAVERAEGGFSVREGGDDGLEVCS